MLFGRISVPIRHIVQNNPALANRHVEFLDLPFVRLFLKTRWLAAPRRKLQKLLRGDRDALEFVSRPYVLWINERQEHVHKPMYVSQLLLESVDL
jgi:hypothetical protein